MWYSRVSTTYIGNNPERLSDDIKKENKLELETNCKEFLISGVSNWKTELSPQNMTFHVWIIDDL